MNVEVVIPSLGESVTEATIASWHKKPGDSVKVDELLLEIDTEKVALEVNATAEGVLESVSKNEGDTVTVGEIVGQIKAGAVPAQPVASEKSAPPPVAAMHAADGANTPSGQSNEMPPSVRKIVAENNLDPAAISGSGKDGRLNKGDVLAALNAGPVAAQPASQAPAPAAGSSDKPVERVTMSRLRKTIATRLKESQNTAAILTTFNEIDMHNVIAIRKKYKEEFEKKHGIKLGFMSFFVKAAVHALKEIPAVNSEIAGDDILYKQYYDIGVAVGTKQGLVVPVVAGCDKRSFAGVEQEIVDLAGKARTGKLSMKELSGGTFTITNGGVYGSMLSTPIINPPQTGILGLHNTVQRPVVIDGEIVVRPMMYVALSYDHRIIDGKDAVTFLVKIKQAIENPERLLFEL